jgi:hypothetical protein
MRQGNPHGAAIYQKLYVDRIRMASCDGNNQRPVDAVQLFAGPSIFDSEIVVHELRL